jgi:hypothetical protein
MLCGKRRGWRVERLWPAQLRIDSVGIRLGMLHETRGALGNASVLGRPKSRVRAQSLQVDIFPIQVDLAHAATATKSRGYLDGRCSLAPSRGEETLLQRLATA